MDLAEFLGLREEVEQKVAQLEEEQDESVNSMHVSSMHLATHSEHH